MSVEKKLGIQQNASMTPIRKSDDKRILMEFSRILIRIQIMENFDGKYIRLWNSSWILIRILVGNAADPSDHQGISLKFWSESEFNFGKSAEDSDP